MPYNNHVVKDTVSPSGTSIDLFDYWVQTCHQADGTDASNQRNMGINSGKRLKFTYSGFGNMGQSVNAWTGSARPNFNIVQNTLVNGYPQLKAGRQYDSNKTTDGTQSLDYLFDPASTDSATQYRKTYTNLKGLLQLKNGYYTYDSAKNFAALVTKAGDFATIGFGEFSFSKPGAYVYKVTEVAGSDATLSYATNVRYLRFRVEGDQMKGVYSVIATTPGYDAPTATDENDGAAFVNVCRSAEQLPLTGGLTTRNFLIVGGIVGLLAVIAGFAVHEWWLR